MLSLVAFVVAFLASSHCHPGLELPSFDFDQFVIGGTEAKPNEFPWQLSLQYLHKSGAWKHTCGASLLSSKYGLTAAHCVQGREKTPFRVVAGLHKLSSSQAGTVVNVTSFKYHERYNDGNGTFSNDIAILKFKDEIKFSATVKPAVLPKDNKNKLVNETCIISGWGRIDASNDLPDSLQKGTVKVISNNECQDRVGSAAIIDGHMCIFDPALQTSACNGDSGGPVTCKMSGKDTVVGIASWVISVLNKCRPAFPSAYTRVSEYLDWIKLNTP